MKCFASSPTQTNRAPRLAFSLLEMMVATGIVSIILLAVMQVSMYTARSFVALGNYNDLDRISRNALDTMSRDIRQAKVLGYYSTNRLFFTNLDNSSAWFGYTWAADRQVVARVTGTADTLTSSNVVLTGCDFFSFRIWLRNPTNGFEFPYTAQGQSANAKLVDVSWRCKRKFLNQFNTESVQTAKIVLRN